jgi:hypothetical protein
LLARLKTARSPSSCLQWPHTYSNNHSSNTFLFHPLTLASPPARCCWHSELHRHSTSDTAYIHNQSSQISAVHPLP